jgi:hypothetical protein
MSSGKKRKVVDDHSTTERSKSTFYLPNAIPRHVYVVQSLAGDEHETMGIYTSCEVANTAAQDHYNKNSPYGTWTIRKPIEPEHEKFRNGKEYSYVPDEDLEESSDGQIGCVRRRHDGGLRFGASSESGTYIVWVERKELDMSRPPAIPRSGVAKNIKVEHGISQMVGYRRGLMKQVGSPFQLASSLLFEKRSC